MCRKIADDNTAVPSADVLRAAADRIRRYIPCRGRAALFVGAFGEQCRDVGTSGRGTYRRVGVTAALAQSERLCGTLCADHQGVLLGPDDPAWGGLAAEGDPGVRGALSLGTESPRTRQPTDHSRGMAVRNQWPDPTPSMTGWDVELLLPGRLSVFTEWQVNVQFEFLDITGTA